MTNRLAAETSPYLLQHKDNPVHWWAWGPEALAEAQRTGKPILLSVGYAACHWCHVMAHESFEDDATAAVMNELFVNIKVDREERPDIDAIYMAALHKLGQQGGWPLTMFLNPEARPFWGGTYFPPRSQWGRPAFVDVLKDVSRIHRDEPEKIANNTAALTAAIAPSASTGDGPEVSDALIAGLAGKLVSIVDTERGGIRGAPKFPQWSFFWLLWRAGIRYGNADAVAAVETTLVNICQGGIYDHLGGGFSRYSVDEQWLVPHFEKMLYDNALLIDLMTEVWRETKNPLFETRIAETVDWLEREMIADGGGFAASLDADSEGEEGKFYVWTADEIGDVLGANDAAVFAAAYGVTPEGNFEGHTILNRLGVMTLGTGEQETALRDMRAKLLARRAGRIRPGWDDKVLADWNGLMIAALARASQVFSRPDWLALATTAFEFVATRMTTGDRLHHASRLGRCSAPGTAADYANMILAAIRLTEATLAPAYLEKARRWATTLETHHANSDGGYFTSADDTRDVIVRMCAATDDAVPNANATMVSNLGALMSLTGEPTYLARAGEIVRAFAGDLARSPTGHAGLLAQALDVLAPQLVVLTADNAKSITPLRNALYNRSIPGAVELVDSNASTRAPDIAALEGKSASPGQGAAYLCLGSICSQPITDAGKLFSALNMQRKLVF